MVFCLQITIINKKTKDKLIFTSSGDIEIKKTWRKYTDTASVKFPRKLYINKNNEMVQVENIKDIINVGDKIIIELGYNSILVKEYEGYISVPPVNGIPYELICEDEMWLLKQQNVSIHIEDATVREILTAAAPNYEIYCADEFFGDFSIENATPVQVFENLRKTMGLYTFFREKRIVCGLPYSDKLVSNVIPKYVVGKNVIENDISIRKDENAKVKVYGSSIQNNGARIKYEKGEEGGLIVKVNYENQISLDELKKVVNKKYEINRKAGNVTGKLLSYGFPYIEHGQTFNLIDNLRDNINEKFFIDEININVSLGGGYRKELIPGQKITNNNNE